MIPVGVRARAARGVAGRGCRVLRRWIRARVAARRCDRRRRAVRARGAARRCVEPTRSCSRRARSTRTRRSSRSATTSTRKLPDASMMFHDAGAIAYYGDGRVYDMLGLVTNHQAGVANNGPGARFEFLESLPPERAADALRVLPGLDGHAEFFGEVLMQTPLARQFHEAPARRRRRHADHRRANCDHVATGEHPLDRARRAGASSIASTSPTSRASARTAGSARSAGASSAIPTARWSLFDRAARADARPRRRSHDPCGRRALHVDVDPAKPTRLVMRTGGAPQLRLAGADQGHRSL